MMKSQIIIVHIGPVQEFIASARRTRDLWFGSWLVSELAKTAALKLVAINNNRLNCLIFPAPEKIDDLKSPDFRAPNKVVAYMPTRDCTGERVKAAVLGRLERICDETFVFGNIKGEFNREVAKDQVLDLPEIYWVTCPLSDNYVSARKYAEAMMAARKSSRDFKKVSWGSSQPKSSLDGLRESVLPVGIHKYENEKELRQNYDIRHGEHLCGVGMLKRHGRRQEADRFPSTSHMAAFPLLTRLKDQDATDKFIKRLLDLRIAKDALGTAPTKHPVFGYNDGHLLYAERLQEFFTKEEKKEAQRALEDFLKAAFNNEKPLPYYAILKADGDNMGKIIDQQKKISSHQRFSRCLSQFAIDAEVIVKEESGALVFSGGDDVTALVPVHKALTCARRLSKKFRKEMARFEILDNGEKISPTLSVGLVVAHHLEPLSAVLSLAGSAEREAKGVKGKNALAIKVNKRSGVTLTVKDKWGKLDRRLEDFINMFADENFSRRVVHELRNLSVQLGLKGAASTKAKKLNQIACAEAKRIIKRKSHNESIDIDIENAINQLEKYLDEGLTVVQLAEELLVARSFAEAIAQSKEPQSQKED